MPATNPKKKRTRAEAARENGKKSHGPRTQAGKARSSLNSFKHGLRSSRVLIPGESLEIYNTLLHRYNMRYLPRDQNESGLVIEMVNARWRTRRFQSLEPGLYTVTLAEMEAGIHQRFPNPSHEVLQALVYERMHTRSRFLEENRRAESRCHREYERAFRILHKLLAQQLRNPILPAELNDLESGMPANSGDYLTGQATDNELEPLISTNEPKVVPASRPQHPLRRAAGCAALLLLLLAAFHRLHAASIAPRPKAVLYRSMQEAVIVDCRRTAVGRSGRGTLRNTRPDDMGAAVVQALLAQYPQVSKDAVDDVIFGCAMPEAESGMNIARVIALRAGLPDSVPGVTINRFCSSGLQAIAMAADRIRAGGAGLIIAGGVESMSMIPMTGVRFAPSPWFVDHRPGLYMGMGLTAEMLRKKYGITREDQDAFSYRSHQNALKAQAEGKFDEEIVPLEVSATNLVNGKPQTKQSSFTKDEGPRADTSLEALGKLKPVFATGGTVTAGNSSQTSDGAAAAIVMSARMAADLGLKPMARYASFAVGGVPPEIMGIGPVVAIPKALGQAGLKLEDIGVTELNEAFAVQALAVIRESGLNIDTVNVNGGAIALGHPLGCTGAKLTASILREMKRRNAKYGMVTMCVGGGQGAAGIFESLN